MPRRPHPSSPTQTVIDFDATAPAPAETSDQDKIAEAAPTEYSTAPAWIDTAGRTRTWSLKDPHGTQLAEITTKRDAEKLAELLTRVMGDERGIAR